MNKIRRTGSILGVFVMTALAVTILANASRASAVQPAVAEHFRAGQQDIRAGRFTEAVQEFQEVLRLAPGLSEARINLGLAYHELGRYRLAVAALEKGLEQNPNVLGGNIVLGLDELKLGFPGKAIPPLRRAIKISPSNQEAWSGLAEAYLALGKYLEASRAYDRAFRNGDSADNWFHLGHAYLTMSNQLTRRMAHDQANSAWAKRLAGDLLSDSQRWGEAAQKYRQALARDPSQPGLHLSLANVLLAEGNVQEAQREYQSELRLDPASPLAILGLCRIELDEERANQALAYVSKLATTAPRFLRESYNTLSVHLRPSLAASLASHLKNAQSEPGAHFLLAALFERAGEAAQSHEQLALAQSELTRRSRNDDSGPLACKAHRYESCARFLGTRPELDGVQLLTLGKARFALGQYDRAGAAFAAALAQRPRDPEALYWLIRSDSKVAGQCFHYLVVSYPGSAQAHELAAESYRARGQNGRAIQQYQLAEAIEPGNANLHEALGDLYLSQHRLVKAQAEISEALRLDPTRAHSLYLMGRLEIGVQKPKAAIAYLQKALSNDPHLLQARASLGLAYLRSGQPALAIQQLKEAASIDYYGDLHYMLYQAYQQLGEKQLASQALAASQTLRRSTEARDQTLIQSADSQ